MFDRQIVRRAVVDSLIKLNPRTQARNPVMFVVLVGSVWTTALFFRDLAHASTADNVFVGLVAIWLWFTVLFANFAEALAEGRGKAQADTLRKTRSETVAFVLQPRIRSCWAAWAAEGCLFVCAAGGCGVFCWAEAGSAAQASAVAQRAAKAWRIVVLPG